jgi:voltage-gated potassium channel Kch
MARFRLIERRMARFLDEPASVRSAAAMISLSTVVVVVGSGVLMRVLDSSEYPTISRGLWWAIQTVTTVGYGDVTPAHTSGRIVAVLVMLWGIAFVAIVVAAVTSTFVTRAEREHERDEDAAEQTAEAALHARFDDLAARLDRLEDAISQLGKT